MNFISQIGVTVVGIVVLLLVIAGGWLYIDHLKGELGSLQSQVAQATGITKLDKTELETALSDMRRQGDILARERNEARAEAATSTARYKQIMEAKNGQDGPISDVLCNSLKRVYESTASTHLIKLPVQHPGSPSATSKVAQSPCAKITQKDVSAWLETQVYPAFKSMQRSLTDLQQYTTSK